jgi:hypothetical protein
MLVLVSWVTRRRATFQRCLLTVDRAGGGRRGVGGNPTSAGRWWCLPAHVRKARISPALVPGCVNQVTRSIWPVPMVRRLAAQHVEESDYAVDLEAQIRRRVGCRRASLGAASRERDPP